MTATTSTASRTTAPGASAPTGEQWTIEHGSWAATVVEVGGGLRTLTCDGLDLVAGYDVDERCASGRGQQLMPWPNRIRDGRYTFEGTERQLPLTEVPLRNASHGLVRWAVWQVLEHTPSAITLTHRLHPQPGWDHTLDLRTTYAVGDDGLTVTTAARNVGGSAAPFGYGAHPYLATGTTPLSQIELRIPATEWVEVDDRSLPAARHPADGAHDFRELRAVGEVDLDTAYTGVLRDPDGAWRVTVASSDRVSTLWADESFGWLQVFTAVARDQKGVPGVAVEPMSCPADAFNSGDSVVVLAPGQEWTGTWGITAGDPARSAR